MSTLLEALSDGSYDMQNKRDLSGNFSKQLLTYRDSIVSDYLKYKTDLSQSIAKVAKRDSLNDDQIQRIIEEVNNQVYLIEYDKLKASNSRDVEFDIASMQSVKKHLTGETGDEKAQDNSSDKDKEMKKSAFEQVKIDEWEKTASYEDNAYSNAPEHKYCDMSVFERKTRDEYMLQKIAKTVEEKQEKLEKIAGSLKYKTYELGDTIANLERLGADTLNIVSSMVKVAGLTEKEFELIKEASAERVQGLIEARYLPTDFVLDLSGVSLEKTASERFSLGKFSQSKTAGIGCDAYVPKIELSTGRAIQGFNDIVKLASELKDLANELVKENDAYVAIREKCASIGITNEMLEDYDFFQLSQAKK